MEGVSFVVFDVSILLCVSVLFYHHEFDAVDLPPDDFFSCRAFGQANGPLMLGLSPLKIASCTIVLAAELSPSEIAATF